MSYKILIVVYIKQINPVNNMVMLYGILSRIYNLHIDPLHFLFSGPNRFHFFRNMHLLYSFIQYSEMGEIKNFILLSHRPVESSSLPVSTEQSTHAERSKQMQSNFKTQQISPSVKINKVSLTCREIMGR